MNILDNNYMKNIEKEKDRIIKARLEKNSYLGEFKERVLLALNKEEVEDKIIYPEVIKALNKKIASKMIISRDLKLDKIKKYIYLAKKMNISFKLVDGLSYKGDVALVIVAKEALKNPKSDPIVKSFKERILDVGLDEIYYESIGKKICQKYYDEIKNKLPEFSKYYEVMNFWDKIIGYKCPIKEKLES